MDISISDIKHRIIAGGAITPEEAYVLADLQHPEDKAELREAAAELTARFIPAKFDTCSFVNALSCRCQEDCIWCAQSAHYHSSAEVFPLIDRERCLEAAARNRREGIGRFSLVTSGRAMRGAELRMACSHIREMAAEGGMGLCASRGLLDGEALAALKEAGVTRYHCNLETAPSHFATLCSTHTIADKLATISAAREAGLDICSGGIIGMGETPRQRVEFALALLEAKPVSIPINILMPIPGTPLEQSAPISEDEILTVVAIFRMIHPRAVIRFAGGRSSISRATQLEALRIGVTGAIVGDMLTTVGSTVASDRELAAEAGLDFD